MTMVVVFVVSQLFTATFTRKRTNFNSKRGVNEIRVLLNKFISKNQRKILSDEEFQEF